MIWLACVLFGLAMGIFGEGWFWFWLALIGAFVDVAWVRDIKARQRQSKP